MFQVPWEDYSEDEVSELVSLMFRKKGFSVYNVHRLDRRMEDGIDIECKKSPGESRTIIAIKKKPEKKDVVRSESDGQFKRYFPLQTFEQAGTGSLVSASDKATVMMLRQPVPFRVVVLLARRGCMAHKNLAKELRKSPSTLSHHLEKLQRAGVVSPNPDGRGYVLADEKRIARILLSFNPMPSLLANGFLDIWEDLRFFSSKDHKP